MVKINSITIENYRSIKGPIEIKFKENQPVVLIGENNSGKTNILRAIDIMFGESYPKYKNFEDHEYYNRDVNNKIIIRAKTSGFNTKLGRSKDIDCNGFLLEKQKNNDIKYVAIQNDGQENQYVSNELREELCSIFISTEQKLSYQLSYASKYTIFSKVTKAFHDKLISNQERVNKLKDIYKQILNIFDEVDGFKEFTEKMSNLTGEYIQNMTHALQLDFSAYDPSNYFKNLRVQPFDGNQTLNFDELGSGQQQILALSFAHAYAKCFKDKSSLILLIDEPETNLHPLAQKWLARTLFRMAEDGLQMVISTHTPYFIDLKYLESIYLVRKTDTQTIVTNKNKQDLLDFCHNTGANQANGNTIIPYYQKSATTHIIKGFFAKKVILVEGPTEELALPIYLENVGLDLLKEGIDIISVSGKGELAKWWRLFRLYEIPCYMIFDNDNRDDAQGNKRKDALKTIGIKDSEIQNIISSEDWNIGDRFCVFGKDFEETMRNSFTDYRDLEKEVKNELGDSKPLVAREVSLRLKENENDGWKKMKELKNKIINLDQGSTND